jgi:hypothetical protein
MQRSALRQMLLSKINTRGKAGFDRDQTGSTVAKQQYAAAAEVNYFNKSGT